MSATGRRSSTARVPRGTPDLTANQPPLVSTPDPQLLTQPEAVWDQLEAPLREFVRLRRHAVSRRERLIACLHGFVLSPEQLGPAPIRSWVLEGNTEALIDYLDQRGAADSVFGFCLLATLLLANVD